MRQPILIRPVSSSLLIKEGLVFSQPQTATGQNEESPFHRMYKNFYPYSCVSPLSGKPFALFLSEVNTNMMNLFFEQLAREYPDREIIIVMDQT